MQGICDICNRVGFLHVCQLCGRRVCDRCFLADRGVCILCFRGRFLRKNEDMSLP
ncbi:MAG TPA: orotate phosphoribosyltransferase [Candidatus Altiarchaeales archaeon]|nr:MAG: orotate phosphoribosyltransferase [Candidatus Altiarchaeales archaeon]HDN83503.1 orotate phosphoribosyltransferase [Candidatus Altiarchaeales archaeon]